MTNQKKKKKKIWKNKQTLNKKQKFLQLKI